MPCDPDAGELAAWELIRLALKSADGVLPPVRLREDPAALELAHDAAYIVARYGTLAPLTALTRIAANLLILRCQQLQGGRWPTPDEIAAELLRLELAVMTSQQDLTALRSGPPSPPQARRTLGAMFGSPRLRRLRHGIGRNP